MAETKIKCAMCGSPVALRRTTRKVDIGLDGPVTIDDAQIGHCDACGEDYLGVTNMGGLLEQVAQKLALKPERLTSREIRFLRTQLHFSGVKLACELGVKPETAYRWERADKPAPMSLTAERLLRLVVLESSAGIPPKLHRLGIAAAAPSRFRMRRRGRFWTERKAG